MMKSVELRNDINIDIDINRSHGSSDDLSSYEQERRSAVVWQPSFTFRFSLCSLLSRWYHRIYNYSNSLPSNMKSNKQSIQSIQTIQNTANTQMSFLKSKIFGKGSKNMD